MTPEEAMQEVRRICADPKYRGAVVGKDLERVQAEGRVLFEAATKPMIDELQAAGIAVKNPWDLANHEWKENTPDRYDRAVPILLKHLPKDYPGQIKAGMLVALKVPQAQGALNLFIEEYKKAARDEDQPGWRCGGLPGYLNGDVKFRLADTIVFLGKRTHLAEILDLARDPRHGSSRLALLAGLRHSKRPEVKQIFVDLADDTDLSIQISEWLESDKKRQERARKNGND